MLRSTLLTGAFAGTLLLTGCGRAGSGGTPPVKPADDFATKSATTIVKTGLKELSKVESLRLKGHMILDGKVVAFDFRTDPGGRCGGTMSMEGGTAQIVATATAAYLKGDDAFWKAQTGSAARQVESMLAGRWAKTPKSSEITALCRVGSQLADHVGSGDLATATAGKVTTVDGNQVIPVDTKDGKESYRVLVGVERPHYLRKVISLTPGDEGELVFSGFGDKTPVDVPGRGEYVDIGAS